VLRWGLPRDPAAVRNLVAFAVTTILTVLLTRGLLALAHYPKVGRGGLHIAHVLWGGLLLAVAVLLLVSFIGPVARPVAVLVGGVGFGLFLDEVGKFVTADNDYFYRPAVAIMYVVVVGLLLVVHALHGRRERQPVEYLAAAVDAAVAGVAGGFTAQARADALRLLDAAGEIDGAAEARALVTAIPFDDEELPDPPQRVAAWIQWLLRAPAAARWPVWTTVVLLPVDVVATAVFVTTPIDAPGGGGVRSGGGGVLVFTVAAASALLGVLLVARGLIALGRGARQREAFDSFRAAMLVSILVTDVFQLIFDQWAALGSTVLDLALFAVVAAERTRLIRQRRREHVPDQ
jgi:hypothetical protein